MCFPERATSPGAKYPDFRRVTIRHRPAPPVRVLPGWRPLALLACLILAACEATAPVPVVEQAVPERPAVAGEDAIHGSVDLADLRVSESCEREGDRLCAVEALARFVESASFRKLPAAPAAGQADGNRSRSARLDRQSLNDRLWRLTGDFLPAEVAFLAQHHELSALWRLREAMSGSRAHPEQAERLRAWMVREAGHPFVSLPPGSLADALEPMREPGRVALFVPLSGALAAAGRAVRDGFIAAYLDDTGPLKPPVRIYDTAAAPIAAIYERSFSDGVDLIVGPLSKGKLEALRGLNPRVAVLGLNYIEASGGGRSGQDRPPESGIQAPPYSQPPFLQLGLAVEDEAATITEHLLALKLRRLLAIRGTEDWAVRGVRALTDSWPFDVELQAFTDVRTVTESVGAAMGVAASEERKESLERLLNRQVEFQPRARSDLDGVVAFVDHLEATALAPALKYHLAGRVPPIYASSQSVRNASSLAELSGFHVTEMPFNLYAEPLWSAVKTSFGGGGNVAALRSLGMDAFRIVSLRGWVSHGEPVYGATGRLRLERDGQVRRRLAWATVSGGRVRPLAAGAAP